MNLHRPLERQFTDRHLRFETAPQIVTILLTLWLANQSLLVIGGSQPGWAGTLYPFDHTNVKGEEKQKVLEIEKHIIPERRSNVLYEELNQDHEGPEPWPGAPRDADGDPVHNHFFGRFHGILSVPKEGTYKFVLSSDDGSILFMNGVEVSKRWLKMHTGLTIFTTNTSYI